MRYLFELENVDRAVSATFGLRDINLRVAPGEIVGLVGTNGAGKTTAIRALLGLLHIDSGEIRLFDQPFEANAPDRAQRAARGRIGVVFDSCPYPGELTVKQAARCVAPAFPQWNNEEFERLTSRFGISLKTKVKELSRGMGMKLQLAMALSHDAELLVLDEATAGLDPIARDEMLNMLAAFVSEGERGVLLSSHITSDLEHIADRVVGIDAGSIIFDMPREAITDAAGIAHCTLEQARSVFDAMQYRTDPTPGRNASQPAAHAELANLSQLATSTPRALRREFSCDVLVADRFAFARDFPAIACDRATIDDYLQFALRGQRTL